MPHSDVQNMEDGIDYTECEGWYDNDLELAAELGKTLLERNKELEEQLVVSQQQNQDQALQIVYLEKQLQVLRDVTETKAKIYEDLDSTSQKLEKTNDSLNHELRTARQRIASLSDTIENLETKIVDQREEMESLRKAEKTRLIEGRKQKRILENLISFSQGGFQLRRAQSFDLGRGSSIYEDEVVTLQMNLRNTRGLLASKERREGEMEAEIAVLLKEKASLERGLRELSVKAKMDAIKHDRHLSLDDGRDFPVCHFCDRVIHEEGGEGDPDPVPKLLSTSTAVVGKPVEKEISILSEIDSQYRNLMEKYNALLEHSRTPDGSSKQRTGSLKRRKDSGIQTTQGEKPAVGSPPPTTKMIASSTDAQRKSGRKLQVQLSFEHSPPEYRQIFQEIFEILERVKQPYSGTGESKGGEEKPDTETS